MVTELLASISETFVDFLASDFFNDNFNPEMFTTEFISEHFTLNIFDPAGDTHNAVLAFYGAIILGLAAVAVAAACVFLHILPALTAVATAVAIVIFTWKLFCLACFTVYVLWTCVCVIISWVLRTVGRLLQWACKLLCWAVAAVCSVVIWQHIEAVATVAAVVLAAAAAVAAVWTAAVAAVKLVALAWRATCLAWRIMCWSKRAINTILRSTCVVISWSVTTAGVFLARACGWCAGLVCMCVVWENLEAVATVAAAVVAAAAAVARRRGVSTGAAVTWCLR
jgi:hypothetical protein